MREYLRRRQHRGDETDEHNVKPSEVVTHQADNAGPNGATYVRWDDFLTLRLNFGVQYEVCNKS